MQALITKDTSWSHLKILDYLLFISNSKAIENFSSQKNTCTVSKIINGLSISHFLIDILCARAYIYIHVSHSKPFCKKYIFN